MKKRFWRNALVASGMMLLMSPEAMASGDFIENDVTPPWGKLSIVGATQYGGVSYVENQTVTVQIYANDDKCDDTEIKYYISTSEILDTEKVETWYDYTPGKTQEVLLPSTTSVNTIYAVFKDKNGNTSLIFSNLKQNVEYNVNAANATMKTGVNTSRTYGAPFMVTNQTPTREGYYFKGWGLNSTDTIPSYYAEDIIYPDESIGTEDTLTFYAIWTTETKELPLLADVAKVGDYVNYPVAYDNVPTSGTSEISSYEGWRVISKATDIDGIAIDGTVNLVSAGVPMTYTLTASEVSTCIENLTINFLETTFTNTKVELTKTGFSPNLSLTEIFTNKYTATYENDTTVTYPTYDDSTVSGMKKTGILKVRAMTKEDLDKVYDITGATITSTGTSIKNVKYQGLLAVPCSDATSMYANYWLASASNSNYIRRVMSNGSLTYTTGGTCGVRPVVSLKPEVRVTGKDAIGAWNIEI